MYGGEVLTGFSLRDLKNGDILEELEIDEDEVKGEGKGKGHPRTGHEGPEVIVMKFYIKILFRKFVEKIQDFIKI